MGVGVEFCLIGDPFSLPLWELAEQRESGHNASKWMKDGTWGVQPRQKGRVTLEGSEKILHMALAEQSGSNS